MEIITAIIVDDEEFSIIDIKDHLCEYPNIEVIGTFSDGLTGLKGANDLKPDLVFVDIEMPELNGFEMLKHLIYTPIIVFCSGYAQYAIDGYNFDPSDFLLKPIKKQRFDHAIQRVFKDLDRRTLESRLIRQKQQFGYLLLEYRDLHGDSRKVCVWPDDILYIHPQENNANYLEYHLDNGSYHLVKKTLKNALIELEPQGFFQVHRSYIVNRDKVLEWYKNETLILQGNPSIRIPVSRGYRKSVKQVMKSQNNPSVD